MARQMPDSLLSTEALHSPALNVTSPFGVAIVTVAKTSDDS
jgi:hypothetical protein